MIFTANNLLPGRIRTGSLLTGEHKMQRLEFDRDQVFWNNDEWGRILFNDESSYCHFSGDIRNRVYRRHGKLGNAKAILTL